MVFYPFPLANFRFQHWGEPKPHRTVKDVAFSVARWIARGGSYMNYYMWFGGSNWGRTTGGKSREGSLLKHLGPMIVTSYDYDVALNEYGLPHNPKYSHSAELHRILKSYASVILSNPVDPGTPLDNNVFVNVYGKTGNVVIFLVSPAQITLKNVSHSCLTSTTPTIP